MNGLFTRETAMLSKRDLIHLASNKQAASRPYNFVMDTFYINIASVYMFMKLLCVVIFYVFLKKGGWIFTSLRFDGMECQVWND